MIDVKINASFILPGSVLPAEPPLLKNGKKERKKKKEEEKEKKNELIYRQEKIRLKDNQSIVISLRVAKPVTQNLHLSQEAYDYFTAAENPVKGINTFEWKKLSKNKRVKAHLEVIADSLGGKLESFKIMED